MRLALFFAVFVLSITGFAKDKTSGRYALGVSSDSKLLRVTDPAVSGVYFLSKDSFAVADLVVTGSDPTVYSLGGYYKKNIFGNFGNGFHIGGGYGRGKFSEDGSFWRISANAGAHFIIVRRVFVTFDAGIAIGKDDPGGSTFEIGANSALLGLSLYWIP